MSAITDNEETIHVFYSDATNTNLRHAWLEAQPGAAWRFEDVDGAGDMDPPDAPDGRVRGAVGISPCALHREGLISVAYHDRTNGNLRFATLSQVIHGDPWTPDLALQQAQQWQFTKLDGGGGNRGQTNETVGRGKNALVEFGEVLHCFYGSETSSTLRHAWLPRNAEWAFETFDGTAGGDGRIMASVGSAVFALPVTAILSAFESQQVILVFYDDATSTDLRVAVGRPVPLNTPIPPP